MTIYSLSEARMKLYKIVDDVAHSHQPIYLKGKRNNAVMISEEDFEAMQETLYLLSIPNMKESIIAARAEPIEEASDTLDW